MRNRKAGAVYDRCHFRHMQRAMWTACCAARNKQKAGVVMCLALMDMLGSVFFPGRPYIDFMIWSPARRCMVYCSSQAFRWQDRNRRATLRWRPAAWSPSPAVSPKRSKLSAGDC